MKIEKASKIGFCFGVRRALDILEKVSKEQGGVETLGEIVHNRQVLQKLSAAGVKVAHSPKEITGNIVVLGAHGITPEVVAELKSRGLNIIDTTCPFVHRAQIAAQHLAEAGFYVVIYGDSEHPEVKGVLGWAKNNGIAVLDTESLSKIDFPLRVGILSQTTQIPAHFKEFVKKLLDIVYVKDSQLRIIDTICHDIRDRQAATIELAKKVDLMLVVGGRNSANTSHLASLSSTAARTLKIETAADIQPESLKNIDRIGVTAGASTAEETIDEIVAKLRLIARNLGNTTNRE